jgi:hypothetical protein
LVERALGTYQEGPEPPERLDRSVEDFFDERPDAGIDEVVDFCKAHAREAYRSGFVRGYEHAERSDGRSDALRSLDPERYADALDPTWRSNAVADVDDEAFSEGPGIAASLGRTSVEALLRNAKRSRRGRKG